MFTATIKHVRLHHRRYSPQVRYLTIVRVTHGSRGNRSKPKPLSITERSPSEFEPKSEAWYDHHFAIARTVRPDRRRKPTYPLAFLGPKFAEANVPPPLQQDPLDFALLDRADDASISNCLELYIARVNSQTRGLPKARAEYLKDRPGAKALLALSRLRPLGYTVPLDRMRALQSITHCLVAENDTESIWQWLGTDASSWPKPCTTDPGHPFMMNDRWKQQLFLHTIQAQIHWTSKSDFTADAMATVVDRSIVGDLGIKRLAMQWLCKVLQASSDVCTDVKLYDRFRQITHAFFHRSVMGQSITAAIDLVHPTHPTAARFLQLLRNHVASAERADYIEIFFDPKSFVEAKGTLARLYQTMRVCLLERKPEDAIWGLDFAFSRRPEYFGTATVMDRYMKRLGILHSDREIRPVKRPASALEVEEGVGTDEAGNVMLSQEMSNAIRSSRRLSARGYGLKRSI